MKDTQLIQQYLQGEKEYLDILLEKHMQKIFSACYRVCLNEDDANDITQNVLIKIIRSLSKFKGESSFSTWYYRIAYNESISYLKSKKIHVEIGEVENIIPSSEDIIGGVNAHMIGDELTLYINTLPLVERNIMLYYYYDDLKIKEIAEIMKLGESTVKTKLYRTKKLLSTKFSKHETNY